MAKLTHRLTVEIELPKGMTQEEIADWAEAQARRIALISLAPVAGRDFPLGKHGENYWNIEEI